MIVTVIPLDDGDVRFFFCFVTTFFKSTLPPKAETTRGEAFRFSRRSQEFCIKKSVFPLRRKRSLKRCYYYIHN